MNKTERQLIIQNELGKQGYVLITSLGEKFRCSEETIRRDLKEMEQAGKLTRIHGGAYLVDQFDTTYPSDLRLMQFPELKKSLASTAVRFVHDNDSIMLDSSTTCLAIASELIRSEKKVTIITNSLLICNTVNESPSGNIKLICTGGEFRRRTSSFTDYHTIDALCRYHADSSFISPPKVTMEFGLSDHHLSEARVRECMIRQAETAYLVLDHTKFEPSAQICFEGLDRVAAIITDIPLSEEWDCYAADHGIEIMYC